MLREMIRAEWGRRRALLGIVLAVYLSIPLVYLLAVSLGPGALLAAQMLGGSLAVGLMVAAAAWGSGAWAPERKVRWVYFLALPVGRLRLFALRYAAGLFWLALVVAALAAASFAAAAAAGPRLPAGVYAYPGPFAAWAALASWLLYTAAFAVSARWDHPWRVLLLPVAAFILCFPLLLADVATPVVGPVMEQALFGDFTPLQVLAAPSLIGY